ncbi:hypothetical protein FRC06_011741 [Ceratobasidium sp. 370]|nr:hypothetical protein FRC06_011741 [Ceratobasidium sp. 370]
MEDPKRQSVADTLVTLDGPTPSVDPSTAEKQIPYTPPEIPDGGFTAWATVVGAWLILFCTFGYANAFGVYEDYYTRVYMTNKSSSDIAWVGSTQLCLQFVMGLVSGRLFDAGYFHATIGAGSLLCAFRHFSLFMLSLAKENQYYQVFLPQAIGFGISLGLLFLPSGTYFSDSPIPHSLTYELVGVISHHFARRRSLAVGIVTTGSSCGAIIFPIMLNKIFQRSGFAWGVRATAFVVLGCLIAANLLMRTRLPPKSKRPPTPPPDFKAIMTDSAYLLSIASAFLVLLGLFLPMFYIQLFSVVHGLDTTLVFYTLTIFYTASVFGRTIPNFIADKFGPFNLLIPCSASTGALIFAMFSVKSSGALVVFSILYGFFSGAYISLLPPVIIGLASDPTEIGQVLPMRSRHSA